MTERFWWALGIYPGQTKTGSSQSEEQSRRQQVAGVSCSSLRGAAKGTLALDLRKDAVLAR